MSDDHPADGDREWKRETNIYDLSGTRDPDGTLTGVSCRVEYFEVSEGDGSAEDAEFRRGVAADLEYDVADGVARLRSVTDRNNDDLAPAVLRAIPAGEAAVAAVPGVERVERVEETFGAAVEDGREAVGER